MEELLRIGEVAAFFNVSVKAIRLYDKKGIIKPVKVDQATGYRYYSASQVQQLNALMELKALGFSLSEVKMIMSGETSNERLLKAMEQKKRAWQDNIALAENKVKAIESISNRLHSSNDALKIQSMSDEERAWLLVKMVCVEDTVCQSILSEALWL